MLLKHAALIEMSDTKIVDWEDSRYRIDLQVDFLTNLFLVVSTFHVETKFFVYSFL